MSDLAARLFARIEAELSMLRAVLACLWGLVALVGCALLRHRLRWGRWP